MSEIKSVKKWTLKRNTELPSETSFSGEILLIYNLQTRSLVLSNACFLFKSKLCFLDINDFSKVNFVLLKVNLKLSKIIFMSLNVKFKSQIAGCRYFLLDAKVIY